MGEQVEALEHHADAAALARGGGGLVGDEIAVAYFAGHVDAVEQDVAVGGDLDAVDAAEQRGFAGAAGADDHDDLALGHREVDAIDHGDFAEDFGQAV